VAHTLCIFSLIAKAAHSRLLVRRPSPPRLRRVPREGRTWHHSSSSTSERHCAHSSIAACTPSAAHSLSRGLLEGDGNLTRSRLHRAHLALYLWHMCSSAAESRSLFCLSRGSLVSSVARLRAPRTAAVCICFYSIFRRKMYAWRKTLITAAANIKRGDGRERHQTTISAGWNGRKNGVWHLLNETTCTRRQ